MDVYQKLHVFLSVAGKYAGVSGANIDLDELKIATDAFTNSVQAMDTMTFAFTPQLLELQAILNYMKHNFLPLLNTLWTLCVEAIPHINKRYYDARYFNPTPDHELIRLVRYWLTFFRLIVKDFLTNVGSSAKKGGVKSRRAPRK